MQILHCKSMRNATAIIIVDCWYHVEVISSICLVSCLWICDCYIYWAVFHVWSWIFFSSARRDFLAMFHSSRSRFHCTFVSRILILLTYHFVFCRLILQYWHWCQRISLEVHPPLWGQTGCCRVLPQTFTICRRNIYTFTTCRRNIYTRTSRKSKSKVLFPR